MTTAARPERATAQSRIKRTLTMIGKRKSSVSVAQKRAKGLFTAESKENVSAPSGANFAPTPKDAWGAALIGQEKKLPKSHAVSPRASPRKQGREQALPTVGEWGGSDSPAVRQHGQSALDRSSPHDHPRSRSPRARSRLPPRPERRSQAPRRPMSGCGVAACLPNAAARPLASAMAGAA